MFKFYKTFKLKQEKYFKLFKALKITQTRSFALSLWAIYSAKCSEG